MSNIYKINDLLSLANYAKRYKVTLRKIYRYVGDSIIEHYMIDGVAYLPDKPIPILMEKHTRDQLSNSVKNLTESTISVKILTQSSDLVDNQEVNNVKILTESQIQLLETPDVKLSGEKLEKKYLILKKIEEINNI